MFLKNLRPFWFWYYNFLPSIYYLGHVVSTSIHVDKKKLLTNSAINFLNAIGLHDGPAHVELRLSEKGPVLMEIDPRPAGGRIAQDLLINAYGVNVYDAGLDFFRG